MRIQSKMLPKELLNCIYNPDPLEGEDIVIEDEKGNTIGVIIQPNAYEYFIKKVREREEEIDSAVSEDYTPNSKTLDDLMGDE